MRAGKAPPRRDGRQRRQIGRSCGVGIDRERNGTTGRDATARVGYRDFVVTRVCGLHTGQCQN